MQVTPESRHALSRAAFFLQKARACPAGARVEFEAFLEASIVFARAAVHRLRGKHQRHPKWKAVWDSWAQQAAIRFFREERNWILKEAPPKLGQKVFATSVHGSEPATPSRAAEFYFYGHDPQVPATAIVESHLASLETLLTDAEERLLR
jgi:hypothetical protein